MKQAMQWLATVVFVIAGVLMLCVPSHAAVGGKAFTPTRFTVTDDGAAGKPDVVMIPGLGSSRDVWSAEARLLAPNYRLHIVQVAGFAGAPAAGNVAAPVLPGIVEELHQYIAAGGMHPVVIGHSLGGLLALMLADKHPEDVRKMVIVDSLPCLAALYSPTVTADQLKPIADGMKAQMAGASAGEFAVQAKASATNMVKDPATAQQVAAASLASDRTVFATAMAEDIATDLRGEMASIKTPTLLLYPFDASLAGSDTAKVDAPYQAQYKPMPNVQLVRVDDSRHFVMYDQPAKFDAAVESFLAK